MRAKVNLVQQQHRTSLHRLHHRAVLPHGVAIDKTHTTQQIVLVGEFGDVHTEQFTLLVGTNLFDHRGLAVTGQARDEHRSKLPAVHDLCDLLVVAPRHIGLVDIRNQVNGRIGVVHG